MINLDPYREFLEQQYLDWQAQRGRRATLDEFAELQGISRPYLSMLLSGKRKPGKELIERQANLFGEEIYDVLALPRPDPRISEIKRIYDGVPDDDKDSFVELVEEIARDRGWEPGI